VLGPVRGALSVPAQERRLPESNAIETSYCLIFYKRSKNLKRRFLVGDLPSVY